MVPHGSQFSVAADTAPGVKPGAAVRSIAAEDYRLARDRGASFGRGKEEACAPTASRNAAANARLRKMGLYCRATG
jgi:hypothetical protein